MPVTQSGWPALQASSSLLYTWQIPGVGRLRLRNGSAGFLLAHMAIGFDKAVEDVEHNYDPLDDWGYALRPVDGFTVLSNHSGGVAMDLNATEHPLAVGHTFTDAQVRYIHRRLAIYDGCIRWGGDYNGRLDAMHFEINRPLPACETVARRLMDHTVAGKRLLAANPSQRKVILS